MDSPSGFSSTENVMRLFPSPPPILSSIPQFIISIRPCSWAEFKKSKDDQNCHLQHINATVRRGQNCHGATFLVSDRDEGSEAPKADYCAGLSKRPIIILVIFGLHQIRIDFVLISIGTFLSEILEGWFCVE